MTRWGVFVVAGCLLAASACDDNPTAPEVQPLVFTAALAATSEVSLPGTSEAGATGTATITLIPTRDSANAITGGRITMAFTVQNFPAGSFITLAHIHGPNAPAGVNANVLVNTGLTAQTGIAMPLGSASFTSPEVTADAATVNLMIANPTANFYFNVHTTLNPGGAVRGQLVAR